MAGAVAGWVAGAVVASVADWEVCVETTEAGNTGRVLGIEMGNGKVVGAGSVAGWVTGRVAADGRVVAGSDVGGCIVTICVVTACVVAGSVVAGSDAGDVVTGDVAVAASGLVVLAGSVVSGWVVFSVAAVLGVQLIVDGWESPPPLLDAMGGL